MNHSELTREAIKGMLLDDPLFVSITDEIDYDTTIMMDSMSLVWFLEKLDREFHIRLRLEDGDYDRFDSIESIYCIIREKGEQV